MTLYFRNRTPNLVYVAIGYPNQGCSPINYAKRGWYAIQPGGRAAVYGGRASGKSFYWYAYDRVGNVWDGQYFTDVRSTVFDWCWNTGCSTCRSVGFREISFLDYFLAPADRTIDLVLSSSQRRSKSRNIHIALPTKRKLKYRKYTHGIINKTKRQGKRKSSHKQKI